MTQLSKQPDEMTAPHVFVSYLREDQNTVELLRQKLEARGIRVWVDRRQIKPGGFWKDTIREAIQHGAFFIVCFSKHYAERSKRESHGLTNAKGTFMDEEIDIAIDETRRRSPLGRPFIPVRFSGSIPDIDIGAGKNLRDLHYVDLEGSRWAAGIEELCSAILEAPLAEAPQRIVGADGAELVLIPAGQFLMGSNLGSDDEVPIHAVSLTSFYMDVFPITNARYKQFVIATGHQAPKGMDWFGRTIAPWEDPRFNRDDQPVVCVSWFDAIAYAAWAGKELPSEAQWEYAARGGRDGLRYPWGNHISAENAKYAVDVRTASDGNTSPVGSYPGNEFGLYDMIGNVWEWCRDVYDPSFYERSPKLDPIRGVTPFSEDLRDVRAVAFEGDKLASDALGNRVTRGGSWLDLVHLVSVSCRNPGHPNDSTYNLGFRCVRRIKQASSSESSVWALSDLRSAL